MLEGLKAVFPNAQINFVEGTQFLSKNATPVPSSLLTTDGKPGVRSTFTSGLAFFSQGKPPEVLGTRIDPGIGVASGTTPAETNGKASVMINSEATLTPAESGDYYLGIRGANFSIGTLDNKPFALTFFATSVETKLGRVHLESGKSYALKVTYPLDQKGQAPPQLVWIKFDPKPAPEAIAAGQTADVVIAVVGITSELEGEEMPISEEGFAGGDRTSLDLPKPEEDLIEAAAAAGKPLVVVLMNGSALSVNWAKEHANAILDAWYPGEEGGAAVAETLSGKNNPAGRLPVTFYTGVNQLPPFDNYAMKGRTYRYFDGTPLYPFGYGLSYTTFAYSVLKLPKKVIAAGQPLVAEATVTNQGKAGGDEVVQLYLNFPKVEGAPQKALRGFQRVHLEPGTSKKVRFQLQPRDLSMVSEAGDPIVPEGEFTVTIGGGQPQTGAPSVAGTFQVKGSLKLPE